MRAAEAFDLRDVAQQWVDLRDPDEAWMKYLNYDEGKWAILVVNNSYTREFGIAVEYKGRTVTALDVYADQRPELTETDLFLLKQYQVNDFKASRIRNGCLIFTEWVLPIRIRRPRALR